MTVSHWQRSVRDEREVIEADVCIIGAGIAGAGIAWWLRRLLPDLRVVIVERAGAGAGASGRNAGMILAGLAEHYDRMCEFYGRETARELWHATLEHARYVRDYVQTSGAQIDYEPCGSWRLGFTMEESRNLERSFELLREDGFDAEYFRDDPLARGFHGALGIRSDAGVHPLKLVESLIADSGAQVFENCEVFEVDTSHQSAVLVQTAAYEFRAPHVLLALNAYAPLVDDYFNDLVTPHRGQILVTAPIEKRLLDRLVYTNHGYIYFRQLADGRLLVGGWRHDFIEREAGYADEATEEVQSKLEEFLRARFPEAAGAKIEARWAGTMGFSPDAVPLIGRLPRDERVGFVCGFTGHGFGLALEATRQLVREIFYDERARIFSVGRSMNGFMPTS